VKYMKRFAILATAACFAATLTWAQFPTSKADLMSEAEHRLDTVAKKLNLTPEQVDKIRPLLHDQMEQTAAAREKYAAGDHSDASRQQALSTIQTSRVSTSNQLKGILTPDQRKQWDEMVKSWKEDVTLKGLGGK
jgi:Spy/CpxP family protein refolding chaperone